MNSVIISVRVAFEDLKRHGRDSIVSSRGDSVCKTKNTTRSVLRPTERGKVNPQKIKSRPLSSLEASHSEP